MLPFNTYLSPQSPYCCALCPAACCLACCAGNSCLPVFSPVFASCNSCLPEGLVLVQAIGEHLRQRPELLPQTLSTLFEVVLFEDCTNQWSMSRPMLSLILLNEQIYNELKHRIIASQPVSSHCINLLSRCWLLRCSIAHVPYFVVAEAMTDKELVASAAMQHAAHDMFSSRQ